MSGRPQPRFSQLAVLVVVVVAVVVGVVAFLVGKGFRSSAQVAASAKPPARSVITAPVLLVRPRTSVVLRGTLAYGGSIAIAAPTGLGGSLPVVTRSVVHPGSRVVSGTVLGVVVGSPVIALAGRVPAYDDMAYGSTGLDVVELQHDLQALGFQTGTDTSGWYGLGTAAAVAALYAHVGYRPVLMPARVPVAAGRSRVERLAAIPRGQVVFLSALPATVLWAAPLGASVGSHGLARLASGALRIHGRTDQNTASLMHPGEVGVAISNQRSGSFNIRLLAVHDHGANQDGGGPSASVTFAPISASAASAYVGENLALRLEIGGGDRPRLVVPVTAVFTRADGRAVVVAMRAGRRVPVAVSPGVAYAGKEVVAPVDGDLQAGDQVVVGS